MKSSCRRARMNMPHAVAANASGVTNRTTDSGSVVGL